MRKAADFVTRAGSTLKMEEAADVVILVESAEDSLDFFARKSQRIERHCFSVASRNRQIFSNNFPCDSIFEVHAGEPFRPAFPAGMVTDCDRCLPPATD